MTDIPFPDVPLPRFTLADVERAAAEWGANCGPTALAAMTGLTLEQVRPHLGDFEQKRYTNPTLMWASLDRIGATWRKVKPGWPGFGLVRVQWLGPWMEPNVPARARYGYTHWIGTHVGAGGVRYIWDVNALDRDFGWRSLQVWEVEVAPQLWSQYERATGWAAGSGSGDALELERPQ